MTQNPEGIDGSEDVREAIRKAVTDTLTAALPELVDKTVAAAISSLPRQRAVRTAVPARPIADSVAAVGGQPPRGRYCVSGPNAEGLCPE